MPSFPESEFNVVPIVICISFEPQSSKLALLSIYLFSLVWMHLEMHLAPHNFLFTILYNFIMLHNKNNNFNRKSRSQKNH